eukprot:PhF_6_TR5618/c0_g1_i1/m.8144
MLTEEALMQSQAYNKQLMEHLESDRIRNIERRSRRSDVSSLCSGADHPNHHATPSPPSTSAPSSKYNTPLPILEVGNNQTRRTQQQQQPAAPGNESKDIAELKRELAEQKERLMKAQRKRMDDTLSVSSSVRDGGMDGGTGMYEGSNLGGGGGSLVSVGQATRRSRGVPLDTASNQSYGVRPPSPMFSKPGSSSTQNPTLLMAEIRKLRAQLEEKDKKIQELESKGGQCSCSIQ